MIDEVETIRTRMDMASRILSAIDSCKTRPCLGTRDRCSTDPENYANSYSWQTFEAVGDRIKKFSSGLRRLIQSREYLGICAASRPEWTITDLACILQSVVSVPLYHLLSNRDLAFIINNTRISVVVCDLELLPRLSQIQSQCPTLRHLICMDVIPEHTLRMCQSFENEDLSIHSIGDIEDDGPATQQGECIATELDGCLTVVYTSGSSGFPKGAMLSERCYRATYPAPNLSLDNEHVRFCYRPLAWITDRKGVIASFLKGGWTGFSSGDVMRLMDELRLVAPTFFSAPPTFWNKIHSEFQTALALTTIESEERLVEQFSQLIPTRCKVISIGGAMVSPTVFNFIQRCFRHCRIIEAYGATECGRIAFNHRFLDSMLEYRLESVTEMGYTLNDQPFPRGELLVKTTQLFSGYINDPEETRAALTEDGFFRTGDIVELRETTDGKPHLHVIDRKKNFFKLAQGQFVSSEYLESIYVQSLFIEQIYICGDGLAHCVRAVVVPNQEYTQSFAVKHKLDPHNPGKLFHDAILRDLQAIATKEALRKHEIPARLVIDFQPFTPENGLLTLSMKLCRPKLAACYADTFNEKNRVDEQLKSIIERATGHKPAIDNNGHVLSTMGSDSLSGLRLSHMIRNDLNVSIPLEMLFEPSMTFQRLADFISNPSTRTSTPESLVSQLLSDADLELNVTIGPCRERTTTPPVVFITGATGYVGAFLLAEFLKVYPVRCKCVCLVRCQHPTDPLDRVREQLLLLRLWNDEFQERIIAIRGDLAKHRFGLDDALYEDLAKSVNIIFHCGALVNFILPYSTLRGANVHGTYEIIRFASHTSSCIPIHYISTISVLPSRAMLEISIDKISPTHLKNGYAQSKWVAEKLITKASHMGLLVVIYRLGSIGAHTETGTCNLHDFNTLLITAIMKIGQYPETIINRSLQVLSVNYAVQRIISSDRIQSNVQKNIAHIVNSNDDLPFEHILEGIRSCGFQTASVTAHVAK